ncbi:facilitated trehalose transporter Tret1 isoform X2 [Ceratina calcarata]|uniref:Facilitated trehalose transporter Tret1 isoform X2 n=1 Tax=Ceratina calcarata TaxID=156304 RepID=A0AAJ7JBS7_9HYME|nr:facilitated trehalose transporter Tret1 isoform X2 [Ceratina calcarata]
MLPQQRVSTPLNRAVLPQQYSRVPSVARSRTSSSGTESQLDCSSNTTLLTNASPFNSQTALITEKKLLNPGNIVANTNNHYYVQNLRNNQKALNGSRLYDPLERDHDHNYKQVDPLLVESSYTNIKTIKASMTPQDSKPFKDETTDRRPEYEFQEAKSSSVPYLTQVVAALSLSLGSLVVGYSTAYTSPALVSMRADNNTSFEVSTDMGMWIGSIMPLSALVGGIIGGPCIEYIGRRNTILGTAVPFIVAWLFIALASDIAMVLIGRALCGLCVGIASLSLPVYLGETIQAEVRGTLGLLPTVFGNTGILVCFIAGMYLNWRSLALLGASLPIPFLVLMFIIPETPRWYISKGKTKRARKALQWLRAKGADISEELTAIEKMHIESEHTASQQGAIEQLFKKHNMKPLLISLGLMFFQQFSGINAVIFYTVSIFKDAGSSINENLATIIVGIVNFLSTFIAAAVIDRLGRKMLLYISGVSMFLTLFTFGTFFYVKNAIGADVSSFGWIPLASLIIYVIGFSLGFGPIPWLMMGEILPVKIRGSAASIATAFNWSCTFIVTKTYEDLTSVIGGYGVFWMFGTIVMIGFIFVIACVPETSGRSLEEIEKRFAGPVRRMSAVANMKPTPMAV